MRSKFIGAAAAVAILASGLSVAMAQAPSQQPAPQMQPSPAMPSQSAPTMAPSGPTPAPDDNSAMQPKADEAPTPTPVKQHQMSACQKAIQASEKALKKSQASPETIAQAWQHIENAKQEKGSACKDEAKQAQEML
jgi:hypothetical protein